MDEKIFVAFRRLLFGKFCLFDSITDRAAGAVDGMNGIMLIPLVAASIVSSLRLSSHSFILSSRKWHKAGTVGISLISAKNRGY
jgi:hypothetical protein